ncbi:hypothetical protein J4412_02305 [Candidatus Pacearchaeota archaeon]|nr:hypothetical protein [Candidatus Pacearchaeota archaeon]HIH52244.1 hypothetical protein [Nanoarchaeota archaeon]
MEEKSRGEGYEEIEIENMEEVDIEVTEIFLTEEDINYWISSLEELREKKSGNVTLPLDDESELMINFDEESEEEE